MEYRFNAQDWVKLSATDRARRCRLMAEEASKLAHSAQDSMSDNYLSLARDWENLAAEIERAANI
jgi:hypothetical protein